MSGLFGSSTSTSDTKLNSVSLQQSTYGIAIPLIYGKQRVSTNIIDYIDFKAVPHTTSSGGKGGSSSSNTSYTYTVSMMLALGEGPLSSTGIVWKSSTEYSLSGLGLEFYSGTDTQPAWSYMLSNHSDRAIPYRGIAYAAAQNYDLGTSASLPNLSFEVYGVKSQGSILNGDALINDVMVDILTNSRYGAGFPSTRIGDLTDLYAYTLSNGLLISPQYTSQTKANQIITDLCKIANSQPVWSQGKMKIIPYSLEASTGNGVTFNPSTDAQYDLTDDDFIVDDNEDPIEITRSDTEDAYNYQEVEFRDRDNDYNTDQEAAEDLANIELQGKRTADVVSLEQICERSVAKKVAQNILNRELYVRNTYTFKLSWKYCLLEPMDIINLTNSFLGLNRTPVRIETIEDADDYTLTITAVDVFDTVSGITKYPSQSSDRSFVDYNIDPGNINTPVIFDAPAALTTNGLEVWAGISGGVNCGGYNVWVSENGITYNRYGTVTTLSRQGVLLSEIPTSSSELDTTNDLLVDMSMSRSILTSVPQSDVDSLNTLCYVGGELMAYRDVELEGSDTYKVSYLKRGAYNSIIGSHNVGSQFLRLDTSLFKYPFDKSQIGNTLYIKFTSFNVFGSNEQSLAEVEQYTHVLGVYTVPQVDGLAVSQQYREIGDGTITYELDLAFDNTTSNLFDHADIYILSSCPTWNEINGIWSDINSTFDNMEVDGDMGYEYLGVGTSKYTFKDAIIGSNYTFKVVAVDKFGQSANFDEAPTVSHVVVVKSYTPTVPTGFTIEFSKIVSCSWSINTDTDIDFYELRLDTKMGVDSANLLYRGNSTTCTPHLTNRMGNLYLFAHNPSGKYSPYLEYGYNKPAPIAPTGISFTDIVRGIVVTCDPIPVNSSGVDFYINDVVYSSPNNSYTFSSDGGIYIFKLAYTDIFGEGELSAEYTRTIQVYIDPALIQAGSLSMAKMDTQINNTLNSVINGDFVTGTLFNSTVNELWQSSSTNGSAIIQNADNITSIVTELNKPIDQCGYTAIAQSSAAIELRAKSANLISLINVCPETVTIKSSLLHIQADTLIDGNVIATGMIQSGAVTADKISVSSLSAVSATIGTLRTATTGARTEIMDNLITVYDANNVLRVRLGVW